MRMPSSFFVSTVYRDLAFSPQVFSTCFSFDASPMTPAASLQCLFIPSAAILCGHLWGCGLVQGPWDEESDMDYEPHPHHLVVMWLGNGLKLSSIEAILSSCYHGSRRDFGGLQNLGTPELNSHPGLLARASAKFSGHTV